MCSVLLEYLLNKVSRVARVLNLRTDVLGRVLRNSCPIYPINTPKVGMGLGEVNNH